MPREQEILVLYAVVNGHFDDVAVKDVGEVEEQLLEYATRRRPDVLQKLSEADGMTDEIDALLVEALTGFAEKTRQADGQELPVHEAALT
jgi:F-type H+-transporting ATPase subunit alpha